VGEKWIIDYYKTASGRVPVEKFIDSLTTKAQVKISDALDLLKEFGINLGLPHVKKIIGTSLWELRTLGKNNIRIFYITKKGNTFLLLHGFQKKKQKTDKKEIDTALKRLAEYELSGKN